jgi:hypothetical protein
MFIAFFVSRPLAAFYVAFLGLSEPSFMTYYTYSSYALSHIAEKPKKRFSSKPQ